MPAFRAIPAAKRAGKARFATGSVRRRGTVDPDTIFDCQIKRIHEYKRQLLNALHIVVLYNRLRENPKLDGAAADVLLRRQGGAGLPAGQADHQVHQQPGRHDRWRPGGARPAQGRVPADYCVSLAERLIPASDVSEQISTAGYEASGTSNMKFMMNGALTIGTRDGATIEMARRPARRTSSCSA
jgi:glycogen phosphorylase